MKLSISLGFALCAFSIAAAVQPPPSLGGYSALVRRDVDLAYYFKVYDAAVKNLTTHTNPSSSDPRNGYDFGYAASYLVGVMDGGASSIQKSGASVSDAVPSVIQAVQDDVGTLVTTLISKKSAFELVNACETLRMITSDFVTHNANLTSTLLAKLPSDYQETAQGFASSIGSSYLKASSAFAEGNCIDGSGSSSSTTSIANPGAPSPTGGSGTSPTYDPNPTDGTGQPSQTDNSGQPSQTGDSGNQNNPGRTNSDALSAGAKVGLGVGVSVGVLSLIGGALALWFCLRRRQQPQTPVYSNTAIMPPYPEVEDTGKRELGGVEIQPPPQKSPAPSSVAAAVVAGQPYSQPSTELDGRQHTPGPVVMDNRQHTPGPVEMEPAAAPTPELSIHPYHVYDPGYNQQPQQWHQGRNPHI